MEGMGAEARHNAKTRRVLSTKPLPVDLQTLYRTGRELTLIAEGGNRQTFLGTFFVQDGKLKFKDKTGTVRGVTKNVALDLGTDWVQATIQDTILELSSTDQTPKGVRISSVPKESRPQKTSPSGLSTRQKFFAAAVIAALGLAAGSVLMLDSNDDPVSAQNERD